MRERTCGRGWMDELSTKIGAKEVTTEHYSVEICAVELYMYVCVYG